jgi:hypothetical protein
MFKWLKEKWCDRYHIWVSFIRTTIGNEALLAQECSDCGRFIVTEEGRKYFERTEEGLEFLKSLERDK